MTANTEAARPLDRITRITPNRYFIQVGQIAALSRTEQPFGRGMSGHVSDRIAVLDGGSTRSVTHRTGFHP
jgi:hypothetical protein